jgi:hypothetical protein
MTRIRSRGAFSTGPGYIYNYLECSGTSVVTRTNTTQEPGVAVGEVITISDEVIKGFKRLSSNGIVFFNPMTITKVSQSVSSGNGADQSTTSAVLNCSGVPYVNHKWNTGAGWATIVYSLMRGQPITANRHLPMGNVSLDTSRLIDLACTEVRSSRGRGSANNWENLAEIDKSFKLIGDSVLGAVRMARGRRLPKLKDPANGWLAWKYGVKPVIQDVGSLMEALQKRQPPRVTTRARSYDETRLVETLSYNFGEGVATAKADTFYSATVRAMTLDTVNDFFTGRAGFSFKELVTLPWELVPYSFVLDWVLNVGDVIGACAPAVGFDALGSCYTVETVKTLKVTPVGVIGNPGWTSSSYSGEILRTEYQKSRVVGLPGPALRVKDITGGVFSSKERALTALSLFHQTFW